MSNIYSDTLYVQYLQEYVASVTGNWIIYFILNTHMCYVDV